MNCSLTVILCLIISCCFLHFPLVKCNEFWDEVADYISFYPSQELPLATVQAFVEAGKSTCFHQKYAGLPFKVLERMAFDELKDENLSLIQTLLKYEMMFAVLCQGATGTQERIALSIAYQKYHLKRKVLNFVIGLYDRVGHLPLVQPAFEPKDSFDEDGIFFKPLYNAGQNNPVDIIMNSPRILAVDRIRNLVHYAYKQAIPGASMICKLLKVETLANEGGPEAFSPKTKLKEILGISNREKCINRYHLIKRMILKNCTTTPNDPQSYYSIENLNESFMLFWNAISTSIEVPELDLPHLLWISPEEAHSEEALGVYLVSWDIMLRRANLVTSEIASSSLCYDCAVFLEQKGYEISREKYQKIMHKHFPKIPKGECERCKTIGKALASSEVHKFCFEFSFYVTGYLKKLYDQAATNQNSLSEYQNAVIQVLDQISLLKSTVQFADRGWAHAILAEHINNVQRLNMFPAISHLFSIGNKSRNGHLSRTNMPNVVGILNSQWNRIQSGYVKREAFSKLCSILDPKVEGLRLKINIFTFAFSLLINVDEDLALAMTKCSKAPLNVLFEEEIAYNYWKVIDFLQSFLYTAQKTHQSQRIAKGVLKNGQIVAIAKRTRDLIVEAGRARNLPIQALPFQKEQLKLLKAAIKKAFSDFDLSS